MIENPSTSVSIVVPVYSGEAYLEALVEQILLVSQDWMAAKLPLHLSQILLVDDASKDDSSSVIRDMASRNPIVTPVFLSRNFGQHPATIAGILHSSGDWVVTMDEDLQHDPKKILDLIHLAVRESADIVYGKPTQNKHAGGWRDRASNGFKYLMTRVTGDAGVQEFNSFRLIRGTIARGAAAICAHDTYFDVALFWFTTRRHSLTFDMQDERYNTTGKSGYNFRALISHARRMALTSNLRILRAATLLGFVLIGFSIVFGLFVLLQKTLFPETIALQGWASLMLANLTFSGVVLLMLGIVMEYMFILVLRAHGKPVFFTINRAGDALLQERLDASSPAIAAPK